MEQVWRFSYLLHAALPWKLSLLNRVGTGPCSCYFISRTRGNNTETSLWRAVFEVLWDLHHLISDNALLKKEDRPSYLEASADHPARELKLQSTSSVKLPKFASRLMTVSRKSRQQRRTINSDTRTSYNDKHNRNLLGTSSNTQADDTR